MRRVGLIVLIGIFFCLSNGLPVHAEDSVDKQIKTNITEGFNSKSNQKYEDGVRYFTKALELDPNNTQVWFYRADCYFYLKNYDAALKDLDMVLSLNPKHYGALYDKACIYSLSNDRNEAINILQKVLLMDSRLKEMAIKDKDFNNIRDSVQFQTLTGINVFIDGKCLESDTAPMIVGGRTLVPLRAIFEALGANVEWDGEKKMIHCIKDKTLMTLHINNREARINDEIVKLDTPATISNNRTYVPLRFVAESLGATVNWVANTQQIYITTPDDSCGTVVTDEKKIMESLKENLDYCHIDGMIPNPYLMDETEGLAIFVSKSQEDLLDFQSLSDENKIALLNDYVQANWGDFIGCERVCVYFVFNGKRYAETVTAYQKQTRDLTLYKFKQGIDTNVVIQDKENLFYFDYYGNKKPIFNRAKAEKHTTNEKLVPYKIYFNDVYFASIEVPETWDVIEEDEEVYFFAPPGSEDDITSDNIAIYIGIIPTEMMGKLSEPDAYIEFATHQFKEIFTDFKMETAKLEAKTDSGNGYSFVYTWQEELTKLKGKSMVFISNDGFTMYYELAAEQKNYEKFNEIFEAVLDTLDFNNSTSELA